MKLFDASNIDTLKWPNTQEAQYAKKYLVPLIKNGVNVYIENISAKIYALLDKDLVIPIVVAEDNFEDCYTCSTFGYYISYALQSLHIIKNKHVKRLTEKLIQHFGKLVKWGKLNSIVYINNWLFSTDLYPQGLDSKKIGEILDFLKGKFPHFAISLRSLNSITTKDLQEGTKKLGFQQIAARQVYITDATKDSIFQTRIVKSDLKLMRDTKYQVIDETFISESERSKVLDLYRNLYINQHSTLNPQITSNYIKLAFENNLLMIRALKINGEINGVIGFFERNGIMMCPFLGYDKNHPDNSILYRLLSTTLLLEAKQRGLIFNQSAGASFYKKTRRAEGCIETMAVYTDHLPLSRKISWLILKTLINTVGIKAMRKY